MSKQISFRNFADTISSFLKNAATQARTWTFPDKDGTVAMTNDLTWGSITGTLSSQTDLYNALTGSDFVTISTDTSLDVNSLGRVHICNGTAANYTLTLTISAANYSGRMISFKGGSDLTKLVTIDALNSETIDGALTKVIWSGEYFTMISDGTNWRVLSEKKIPLTCQMRITANQTGLSGSLANNKINLNGVDVDNSGLMSDAINYKITIKRTGIYKVSPLIVWSNLTASKTRLIGAAIKNASGVAVWTCETTAYTSGTFPQGYSSGLVSFTAGDYLELYCNYSGATTEAVFGQLSSAGVSTSLAVIEQI